MSRGEANQEKEQEGEKRYEKSRLVFVGRKDY
jgi:hypothetical protein